MMKTMDELARNYTDLICELADIVKAHADCGLDTIDSAVLLAISKKHTDMLEKIVNEAKSTLGRIGSSNRL